MVYFCLWGCQTMWEMTFSIYTFFFFILAHANTNIEMHVGNIVVLTWHTSWFLQVTSVLQKLISSQSSKILDNSVRVKHIAHARTHAHTVHWDCDESNWGLLIIAGGNFCRFARHQLSLGRAEKEKLLAVGGGRRFLSVGILPVLFLDCACSSCTLCASGPFQLPPPPKLCRSPLLMLSFYLVSEHSF